ncbi:MAG: hypothetical protein RLO50_00770 [Azospirillaceae bacterium]
MGTVVSGVMVSGVMASGMMSSGVAAYTIGIEAYLGFDDISYSGQAVYNNGVSTYAGPIYRTAGRQRVDYFWQGRDVSAVADLRTQEVFALDVFGMHQTFAFSDPYLQRIFPIVSHFPSFAAEDTGERETVNGVETTRYAISGVGHDDQAFNGAVWVAASGAVIMARIDYGALDVTFDLYDYRVGPQDPALFTLSPAEDQPI